MTTNKPDVAAWLWDYRGRHMATTDYSQALELAELPYPTEVEPLIRLSDYEVLAAECEKLRNLLRKTKPVMQAHAGASHLLEGFRPKRNQWDQLVEQIDAALQEEHNP